MNKYLLEMFTSEPIDQIKNHYLGEGIDRLTVKSMPMHCAIHKIDVVDNQMNYCSLHSHDDADELNMIINDKDHVLLYRFVVNDQEFELSAPACVWIPADVSHSANAINGRGTFICMRFPKNSVRSNDQFSQ